MMGVFRKNIRPKRKKIYPDTVIKKVEVHLIWGLIRMLYLDIVFSVVIDKHFKNLTTKYHADPSSNKKVIYQKQKKSEKKLKYQKSSNLCFWT